MSINGGSLELDSNLEKLLGGQYKKFKLSVFSICIFRLLISIASLFHVICIFLFYISIASAILCLFSCQYFLAVYFEGLIFCTRADVYICSMTINESWSKRCVVRRGGVKYNC